MSEDTKLAETPSQFLTSVAKRLAAREGADQALVGILAEHILTAAPKEQSVSDAKSAIVALATERAKTATVATDV